MRQFSLREDVCVVLNEREPLKEQAAAELESRLAAVRCSCTRLKPEPGFAALLLERQPRVAVLDYLLGDYATALDVLETFREQRARSAALILTDEPSVTVAVSAMKLGARDYIELQLPHAVERTIAAILELVGPVYRGTLRPPPRLVGITPVYRACLDQAKSLAGHPSRIVCILGERGAGRNSIARLLHDTQRHPGVLVERDLRLDSLESCESALVEIAEIADSSLMIDHADRYLPHLSSLLARLAGRQNIRLILGCLDRPSAQRLARTEDAVIIDVPPLASRRGDLVPLLRSFQREFPHGTSTVTEQLAEKIANERWPGNIRELRAAAFEAFASPQRPFLEALGEAKSRWERYNTEEARC